VLPSRIYMHLHTKTKYLSNDHPSSLDSHEQKQ
jgi:hypothetical protein